MVYLVVEIFHLLLELVGHIVAYYRNWFFPVVRSLVDEVVLITGGASGIGKLMAQKMCTKGAIVVIWDIRGSKETAQELTSKGGRCFGYEVDITNSTLVNEMAKKVANDVGHVTILINNAGVVFGNSMSWEHTDAQIEKTFAVNSIAPFYTTRAFIPNMIKENNGLIVTVASSTGLAGVPRLSAYCASKFAAVGFSESLRNELVKQGATGVRTTCVCPYMIDTGMFSGAQAKFPSIIPFLKADDVAEEIVYATQTDCPLLTLPNGIHVNYIIRAIFPTRAIDAVSQFLGTHSAFDHLENKK